MMLLLIGDKKGGVIRGIWVRFDQDIKSHYESLLSLCFDICLKWAYEDDAQLSQQFRSLLPPELDVDSLKDYFHLWRNITSTSSILPIPRTTHILPFHFSSWNKFKGGSDTITKLFWNAKHYVPQNNSPAANMLSQLFRFIGATVFRCLRHIVTAYSNYSDQKLVSMQSGPARAGASEGRRTRNRVPIVPAFWANLQTLMTPNRSVQKRYREYSLDPQIQTRRNDCIGNMVFRVGMNSNGQGQLDGEVARGCCALCQKKTHFYCLMCHTWFCGPHSSYKNDYQIKANHRLVQQKNNNIYFRQSCWHEWYEARL